MEIEEIEEVWLEEESYWKAQDYYSKKLLAKIDFLS